MRSHRTRAVEARTVKIRVRRDDGLEPAILAVASWVCYLEQTEILARAKKLRDA